MKFEHCALNVPDAAAMAVWYVENLHMQIVRAVQGAPYTHFLADATGRVAMEIYSNAAAPIPSYADQDPLCLHIAFAVEDAAAARDELLASGATLVSDQKMNDGSQLVMLRDPWGVALQLCQRAVPMVR
ncbi:MAG TPA: VOC family protein [Anaerolineae bacterium]|nr:VOC family protein [Anaerolineae bacterium]HQH40070.1 VOC family protein [Anaerolineae bacterium]